MTSFTLHTPIDSPNPVADPGFPMGGGADPLGGHQPPTHTLFGENVCENKRNGSCWGGGGMHRQHPPGSANEITYLSICDGIYQFVI